MTTQQESTAAAGAMAEFDDFAALLQKEFKPKTDQAKSAVENAVHTLAQQALADTALVSSDVYNTIEGLIAALDKKLSEQVNLILHHADFTEARRRVARPASPRQQHRDRRDAEDPRDEHLQGRARTRRSSATRARPGTRARSSRRSTKRNSASWAATLRLPGRRLPLRPQPGRRRAARRDGQDRRRRARAVHRRRLADHAADGFVARAVEPARPDQDLRELRVRRVALAARVGGFALHRPGHAALPGAPAVRREDQPGRGVRLRGRSRGRRPQPLRVGQLRLRDGHQHHPRVQAVRLVHARSAASSPAARCPTCRCTRSRPTTAAWT